MRETQTVSRLAFVFRLRQNRPIMLETNRSNLDEAAIVAAGGRKTWHFIVGVFALTAAIIGIGAISFAAFQRAVDTEQVRLDADARTTESFEALLATERAYNTLQEAERSQRGYVLTENPIFLEPYEIAVARAPGIYDEIEKLIGNRDSSQAKRLRVLRRLTTLKLEEMESTIEMMRAGRINDARIEIASGYGRRLMDEIRNVMDEFTVEQRRLLRLRQQETMRRDAQGEQSIYQLAALGIALLVAAMVSMVALAYMVYRTKLALQREYASEAQRGLLEAAVSDRTYELTQANAALRAEIESRESAEARLRQAQRMEAVGQLTGGIAHDFNNMLAVVISSLDLLKRRVDADDTRISRLIENARDGADRAATLTARLLAFSRQQSLNPVTVDINRLIVGVTDLLYRTLGDRIRIETTLSDDVPLIFIDPSELENAIINLAANARDAMPEGGQLTLETARREVDGGEPGQLPRAFAVISVSDTGEGMSPEVAERVFEPFFTTKPVGKGTGLGLSQVHGFLHQSGGHIEIDSTPGTGTRVDLILPEQKTAAAIGERKDSAEAPLARGRDGEVVLVVEDETQLRLLTVENLRELGYIVHHAEGGADAMRILEEHPGIGLLFTDVMMPDQTGDELAREATARWPNLNVLYASGYSKSGGEDDAPLEPPAELLKKPYTLHRLAARVRECFDRRATAEAEAMQASGS
jgi:signal transduction histidine kinase